MNIELDSLSHFWIVLDEQQGVVHTSQYFADLGYANKKLYEVVNFHQPIIDISRDFFDQVNGRILQFICIFTDLTYRATAHLSEGKIVLLAWPLVADFEKMTKLKLTKLLRHPACQTTDILVLKDVLKRHQLLIHNLEVDRYEKELSEQRRINVHQSKLASIGELAASVGHEVNNPLAISMGFSDIIRKLLLKEEIKDKKIFELLDKQQKAHGRIKNIVKGLRVYSRIDDEKPQIISLKNAINEIIDLVMLIYSKDGIELKNETPEEDHYVYCIAGELQQVLMNLISNARHAVAEQETKEIRISMSTVSNKRVVIAIADTGGGIPEHLKDKIFKPFFTTKESGTGTGLGLPLVQQFVERMNGEIFFVSEPESGTKFIIDLPLAKS